MTFQSWQRQRVSLESYSVKIHLKRQIHDCNSKPWATFVYKQRKLGLECAKERMKPAKVWVTNRQMDGQIDRWIDWCVCETLMPSDGNNVKIQLKLVNSNSLYSNFRITWVFPLVPIFCLHKVTKLTSDNWSSDNSRFRLTRADFPVQRP